MKFKIIKKYLLSISIIMAIIGGSAYLIKEAKASPIKDPLLRDDVLRELDLEEYKDDYKRPNKEDIGQLTELVHDYDMRRYDGVETLDRSEERRVGREGRQCEADNMAEM